MKRAVAMALAKRKLAELLEAGMEWPDAHTKVAVQFGVNGEQLTREWDEERAAEQRS